MKILVFSTNVYGHFVEYIHHLCMEIDKGTNIELYIYVPSTFIEKKEMLQWPDSNKIHYDYYEESIVTTGRCLRDAFNAARILGTYTKKISPDEVFLLSIMQVMPFVVFFVSRKIRISGIVYNIYLYKWKKESFLRKVEDVIKYTLFSKLHIFNRIFILNDSVSARHLNKVWKTSKFCYLPDPYPILDKTKIKCRRAEFGIPEGKRVFLHFGSLTRRKGTLLIFDIISHLTEQDCKKSCFIFAGHIWDDLKADFYKQYEIYKDKVQILVFDQFCSYNFFADLCVSSDYIVLPYKNTSNSSGIISYGAQFGIPVIVPENGLVPKLVKRYNMGIVVKGDFKVEMINSFSNLLVSRIACSDSYLNGRSVENFSKVILQND